LVPDQRRQNAINKYITEGGSQKALLKALEEHDMDMPHTEHHVEEHVDFKTVQAAFRDFRNEVKEMTAWPRQSQGRLSLEREEADETQPPARTVPISITPPAKEFSPTVTPPAEESSPMMTPPPDESSPTRSQLSPPTLPHLKASGSANSGRSLGRAQPASPTSSPKRAPRKTKKSSREEPTASPTSSGARQ